MKAKAENGGESMARYGNISAKKKYNIVAIMCNEKISKWRKRHHQWRKKKKLIIYL